MIQVQLLLIVLLLNLCGFFFFFNDTATTEIYTLSLHDALPILKPGPARHGAKAHAHCPLGPSYRDRKSTRLNSSHLVISYAVFCLKKKKKIILIKQSLLLLLYELIRTKLLPAP